MSQENEETNHGLINTPMQTLIAAGVGFTAPVFVIMGLVSFYSSGTKTGVGAIPTPQALEQRIQKVGESEVGDPTKLAAVAAAAAAAPVATTAAPAPAAASAADAGKKIYDTTCTACHSTGVANAPKFGDKEAWAPRLAAGFDEVLKIATQGKGGMPPKGGSSASDADFKAAVEYLVNAAK